MLRENLAMHRKMYDPEHLKLADALEELTQVLLENSKPAEAEPFGRECLNIHESQSPDDWHVFNARSMLGHALLGQQEFTDAEPLLRKGYEGMKERSNVAEPDQIGEAIHRLVQLYEAWGKPDKAAEWKQELAEFEQQAD